MTEDKMAGQGHRSDQHEFDPIPGGNGRQEGPGVLWSMGSQRVGHDLRTKEQQPWESGSFHLYTSSQEPDFTKL